MLDVEAAFTYLDFVGERHRAWEARQRGQEQPWCSDPIINSRKFTNVFRVLDPGSQFVFELEDESPMDTLARLFLYRHTNLPSAWMVFHEYADRWPTVTELDELLSFWDGYRLLGGKVFSGAYMVYPQSSEKGTDKAEAVVRLTQRLHDNGSFAEFLLADTQADRFAALRRNKGVADFMSMQILTDYGYTRHAGEDREDEFVVAGPGAKRGAALIWPDAKPDQVIGWAQRAVHGLPDCPTVGGRKPSLMDIQNTLCEFSKYARYASRPSREQLYRPAHPGVQSSPVLPKHW